MSFLTTPTISLSAAAISTSRPADFDRQRRDHATVLGAQRKSNHRTRGSPQVVGRTGHRPTFDQPTKRRHGWATNEVEVFECGGLATRVRRGSLVDVFFVKCALCGVLPGLGHSRVQIILDYLPNSYGNKIIILWAL